MFLILIVILYILINVVCDINYFIRTTFTVISGRIYRQKCSGLNDVTTIYGIGTFKDCDVQIKYVRTARLIRELDFARFHFYDVTGIYRRSIDLNIKSLQGCTLTMTMENIPIFTPYKINTKLVFWDGRSLFLEHEVITLKDGKTRCFLVSRQHALGENEDSTEALLNNLPGSETKPECPEYLTQWFKSMEISSAKLRAV